MKFNTIQTTGGIIRQLREERQLPLRKIAALLDIDVSYYSKIERCEKKATKEQIHRLEDFFEVEKNLLMIPYLSEKIYHEISEEDCADQVLKVAEEMVKYEKEIVRNSMQNKLNVIDLFSGCGGFSHGFESAGFHIVLGVDNDKAALETFKTNHKNSKILLADLQQEQAIEDIVNEVKDYKIDVIIAGPPCQGFSLTGARQKNDDRNKLFYSVFKLAKRLHPQAIIIENVPGLATLYGGHAKDAIITEFKKLKLISNFKVLFAPDYEVPQIRKRIFFVGLSSKLGKFEFPKEVLTPDKYNTTSIAISDLPARTDNLGQEQDKYDKPPRTEYQKKMRNGSQVLFNHVATKHTDHVINVISQVPEGGNHKDLPKGVGDSRKFNEAWTRYHSKKPSKTIDTGHRNHFHYKYNRVPTVRENARLQSFPDSFVFYGTRTQQNKQVGNAVPPLLGFHIAKQLFIYLNKNHD